ncbi:MAG: CHAP domain-containing protein [Mycobacteriales bacterium]
MTIGPRTLIVAVATLTVAGSTSAALVLAGVGSASAADSSVAPPAVQRVLPRLDVPVAPTSAPAATATTLPVPAPAKPVTKPVAKPVTKPIAKPATKPVAAPAAKPAPAPTATQPSAPKPAATVSPAPAPKPAATAGTATKVGDDYPYRTDTTNGSDPWGFTKRQCVSFAAFRLSQRGHTISNSQNWGSALNWDDTARRLGKTVTTTPRVGAIAQWNAGESSRYGNGTFTAGGYGHVAYVTAVYSDGSVLLEQYNLGGNRSYSTMRATAPRYLLL